MSSIDVDAVMGSLRDFQRATARWVFSRMFDEDDPALRFLVADEVGLGKTHVAKGVVAQVIDHLGTIGDERHDIVYICSNSAIARQNLRKLVPKGVPLLDSVDRLTMLPIADLDREHPVNLLAITPGTSLNFGWSTGKKEERALVYTVLRELWGTEHFPARARWLFWAGADTWGADGLERARKDYVHRIRPGMNRFEEEIENVDRQRISRGEPSIGDAFDELVAGLAYQRSFPEELKRLRASFLGDMRRVLATVGIAMLDPDLVILDEFQRFKDLLDPDADSWAAQLARRLFDHVDASGRPTRSLLLSATPYRMYTLADEGEDDHYRDFLSTAAFLLGDDAAVEALAHDLRELRLSLGQRGGLDAAAERCRAIEHRLRRVMARTERLAATPDRSGMLDDRGQIVDIRPIDLAGYMHIGDVAEAVEHHDPVEYWKSSPYLVNFLDGYKLRASIDETMATRPDLARSLAAGGAGLLDWDAVDRLEPIDPQNPRLRWLINDLDSAGAFDVLWLPPSLPNHQMSKAYQRAADNGLTKRLIFSGWKVVPKAVSALVSYESERRAFGTKSSVRYTDDYSKRGSRRLDFSMRDGRPANMTSFLLVWPSAALASLGALAEASPDLPTSVVVDSIRQRVEAALVGLDMDAPETGRVDERWYWAAPLLLDELLLPKAIDDWFSGETVQDDWTRDDSSQGEGRGDRAGTAFRGHIDTAWSIFSDESEPLGRAPDDLADVLVEIALGSPAVCALRSIARVADVDLADPAALRAAARAAWGFRSYFNAPDVTAQVERLHEGPDAPYWRKVLDHCLGGDLQAVLDEHLHVLRDWIGYVDLDDDNRIKFVSEAGARLAECLDVQTSSVTVDLPRLEGDGAVLQPASMRCRMAVPFGTQKLADASGEARVESISRAFNSPFWPFVMTSTSVGQEGLDFHLWCHAVVHWNLPTNPVDLEQREGRVHRYKGLAVRRNLAHVLGSAVAAEQGDRWERMFDLGRSDGSEMVPMWVYEGGPARIERHLPVLPFSRDAAQLPRLRRTLAAYRLAIGQPRQEELLDLVAEVHGSDLDAALDLLRIDLSPPSADED